MARRVAREVAALDASDTFPMLRTRIPGASRAAGEAAMRSSNPASAEVLLAAWSVGGLPRRAASTKLALSSGTVRGMTVFPGEARRDDRYPAIMNKGELMKKLTIMLGLTSIVVLHGCVAEEPPAEETAAPEPVEAEPQALQPLPDFRIVDINWNGTGCPRNSPGTVTYSITADKQTFAVYFRDMIVQHKPQDPTLQYKNCAVGVNLDVPQGWMVAVATINTRGYVDIPTRVVATETSSYSFAGRPPQLVPHTPVKGPKQGDYVFTDPLVISSLQTECGQDAILNINTRMVLDTSQNPRANALFTVEIVDGKFKKIFHLQWKKC
ncbi:DUF4360 domain-containing protein [Sorangium sp. So ce429]